MSQRYKELFPVTPGGTNVHIGRFVTTRFLVDNF